MLSVSSCTKMLIRAYGIKDPKPLTEQQVLQYARKSGLEKYNLYTLDTTYEQFLDKYYSIEGLEDSAEIMNRKLLKKQLYQPLQCMLFDSRGYLMSNIVNCDVGGFPTLNWNRYNSFDQFPIQAISVVDSTMNIEKLLPYLNTIAVGKFKDDFDYQCVIYYNEFMTRNSKKLLKLALGNIEREKKKGITINVHLVNNDHYFSQGEIL